MKAKYTDEAQTIVSYGNASGKPEDLIRLGYMPEGAEIEAYDADGSIAKEQERLAAIAQRDLDLLSITHTLPDGRVIQCPKAVRDILKDAINENEPQVWKLLDNTKSTLTVAEMQEIVDSSKEQFKAIWAAHLEALEEYK